MSLARDIADLASVTTRLDTVGGSSGALSNRNVIINGAMKVAQRGTQTNQTSAYTACDRWNFAEAGASVITTTQDSNVPSAQGFANSLKIDVTTADTSLANDDFAFVRTKFEGQDVQQLLYGTSSAKQITLSFWVSSPKTGIHVVELRHRDASGGTEYNNQQYTITTANTWQKVEMTFVGQTTDAFDDDNGVSLEIVFWLMAGSTYGGGTFVSNTWATTSSNRAAGQVNVVDSTSNNFYLTGVQLEVGDTATDFEHRSFGDELARCQRYTYRINGNSSDETMVGTGYYFGTTTFRGMVNFPVTMRAEPTVSTVDANLQLLRDTASDTSITLAGSLDESVYSCGFNLSDCTSTAVGEGGILRLDSTTSAYIEFDAEL